MAPATVARRLAALLTGDSRPPYDAIPTDTATPRLDPASTAAWAELIHRQQAGASSNGGTGEQDPLTMMHAAGMPMVVGTDAAFVPAPPFAVALPGTSVHGTLVGLVLHGMTPLEGLQAATLNPALALRATDSLGTVEAGKLADLVLLDADPLQDIWNTTEIRAVVANGRYYDRAALDQLLHTAAQAAARR